MSHFKKLLVTMLPFLASSCGEGPKPSGDVRMVDPKDVLYTLPTLCDPAPALEDSPGPKGARSLHEDDWRQIEFVPQINDAYIRGEVAKLSAFEQKHRHGIGWTQLYIRKEHPTTLAALALRFTGLPELSMSALTMSDKAVGGGFALSDGGPWFLYGQRTPEGHVIQLAASPDRSVPSERFAGAVSKLAQTQGLMLVDWYTNSLVDTTSPESVLAWTRQR
jgi:hypothetical protein